MLNKTDGKYRLNEKRTGEYDVLNLSKVFCAVIFYYENHKSGYEIHPAAQCTLQHLTAADKQNI